MKTRSAACPPNFPFFSDKLGFCDSEVLPCFCEHPANWFLVIFPNHDAEIKPAEEMEVSDLFELLCDTCYRRVMTDKERGRWAHIG